MSLWRVAILTVSLSACGLRTTPLENPDPVAHNLNARSEPVIVRALSRNGWRVTGRKPGALYAEHRRGRRVLVAGVTYNEHAARITFFSAKGYGRQTEKNGVQNVHPKVNAVLNSLAQDLTSAFYRAEFASSPQAPVGVLPAPTAPPAGPAPLPPPPEPAPNGMVSGQPPASEGGVGEESEPVKTPAPPVDETAQSAKKKPPNKKPPKKKKLGGPLGGG